MANMDKQDISKIGLYLMGLLGVNYLGGLFGIDVLEMLMVENTGEGLIVGVIYILVVGILVKEFFPKIGKKLPF